MKLVLSLLFTILLLAACGSNNPTMQTPAGYKSVTSCTGNSNALSFTYSYAAFPNGDVDVSCSIGDASKESTQSSIYKAGTVGAQLGNCILTYDLDTATGGYWNFILSSGSQTASATYKDTGSASDGTAVALTCLTN